MIPHGKHLSMRIFPSTFTTRCIKIVVTSLYVNAYFNRLRKIKHNGKHSRCLCGPNSRENKISEKQHRQSVIPIIHLRARAACTPSRHARDTQSPTRRIAIVPSGSRAFSLRRARTRRRLRGEHASELIKHPVLGRI